MGESLGLYAFREMFVGFLNQLQTTITRKTRTTTGGLKAFARGLATVKNIASVKVA